MEEYRFRIDNSAKKGYNQYNNQNVSGGMSMQSIAVMTDTSQKYISVIFEYFSITAVFRSRCSDFFLAFNKLLDAAFFAKYSH